MPLPLHDEVELRRWTVFLVERWLLDHHWQSVLLQALILGMPVTRFEYFHVVRVYLRCRRDKKPKEDW